MTLQPLSQPDILEYAPLMAERFAQGPIRIATRKSPMAMWQATTVADLLEGVGAKVELVPVTTSGDQSHGDLAALGGKGAFCKEIDTAILTGRADIAVHALKDVPGDIPRPDGLATAALLPRQDVRDCLVLPASSPHRTLADLPPGARIGTSSVRRRAQLAKMRPDLHVQRQRGYVNTRIARLDEGNYDALILAVSGLQRLGVENRASQIFGFHEIAPAVGAGVISVETRKNDALTEIIAAFDDPATRLAMTAERMMLHTLQGRCNTPISGLCTIEEDGTLSLFGMVFTHDGGHILRAHKWGPANRAAELGALVGAELLFQGARDLIAGNPDH